MTEFYDFSVNARELSEEVHHAEREANKEKGGHPGNEVEDGDNRGADQEAEKIANAKQAVKAKKVKALIGICGEEESSNYMFAHGDVSLFRPMRFASATYSLVFKGKRHQRPSIYTPCNLRATDSSALRRLPKKPSPCRLHASLTQPNT